MEVAIVTTVGPALAPPPAPSGEAVEGFGAVLADVVQGKAPAPTTSAKGEADVDSGSPARSEEPGDGDAPDDVVPMGAFAFPVGPAMVQTASLPGDGGEISPAGSASKTEAPGKTRGAGAPHGGGIDLFDRAETRSDEALQRAPGVVADGTRRGVGWLSPKAEPVGGEFGAETPAEDLAELAPDREASAPSLRAWGEPAARARAERLWGFWLRQGSSSSPSPRGAEARLSVVPGHLVPRTQEPGSSEGSGLLEEALQAGGEALPAPSRPAERMTETASARTAEVAAATPRPSGLPPQTVPPREQAPPAPPARQVAQAVHIAVSRGGDRVAVHLEPEHLGRVEVILSRDAGGVTAHLRVESPQAHQALASELPALRQALEARGVSLVHVQVDLDDHSQGGQRPGREAGGRRRRGASGGGPGELAQDLLTGAERWRPWGFEALI